MNIPFPDLNIFGAHPKEPPAQEPHEAAIRHARHQMVQAIKTHLNRQQTLSERVADFMASWFGSVSFLWFNAAAFAFWVAWNAGWIPDLHPIDPFPFVFLTMVVSLEAIFLSIFVLMSQKRESRISELREEIDIQVNMIAEQEITKVIHILTYLMKHLNVPYEKDPELKRMMHPLNLDEVRDELERQLGSNLQEKMKLP